MSSELQLEHTGVDRVAEITGRRIASDRSLGSSNGFTSLARCNVLPSVPLCPIYLMLMSPLHPKNHKREIRTINFSPEIAGDLEDE